jgi:exopolysaccharide production protein ExoZ
VGWTLVYEVWFYVLFATSMLFRRYRWLALAMLFATFLIMLPMLVGGRPRLSAYVAPAIANPLLGVLSNGMMWEFAAGALIAALYRSRISLPPFWANVFAATAATIFAWLFFAGWGKHGPLRWGVPSALVLASALLLHKACVLRVPRAFVWLGDISFSLYLCHRIVQDGLARFVPARLTSGVGYAIGSVSLSLIVAAISHRYIERGLSEWLRRRIAMPTRAPA